MTLVKLVFRIAEIFNSIHSFPVGFPSMYCYVILFLFIMHFAYWSTRVLLLYRLLILQFLGALCGLDVAGFILFFLNWFTWQMVYRIYNAFYSCIWNKTLIKFLSQEVCNREGQMSRQKWKEHVLQDGAQNVEPFRFCLVLVFYRKCYMLLHQLWHRSMENCF